MIAGLRRVTGDFLLSLLCGLALLGAARMAYGLTANNLPDALVLPGADPIARLALLRLMWFTFLVALLAALLSWPLTRHAARRDVASTLPGASCAAALFMLLEQLQPFDPFPFWLTVAQAGVLFAALPAAAAWRWLREKS